MSGLNWNAVIFGIASLFIMGVYYPVVIWGEYYFSEKIWPFFLAVGLSAIVFSTQMTGLCCWLAAFFGATAVSEEGALFWSTAMAQFTRSVLARAEKRICLAESDKFGKTSFCLCAGFGMIDRIITDDTHPIPDSIIRAIRQSGTDLSIAALPKYSR